MNYSCWYFSVGVWSWFGSHSTDEDDSSLLANQSLLLLLVLVNHCTQDKKKMNPYRHALFTFINRKVKGTAHCYCHASCLIHVIRHDGITFFMYVVFFVSFFSFDVIMVYLQKNTIALKKSELW